MDAAFKPEIYISYIPDGKVNIAPQIYASYIPNGKVNIAPQIWASVVFVPHVEKATADTSRNLSKLENISADSLRKIGITDYSNADLLRTVKATEKATADTLRRVAISEVVKSRTFRKLTFSENASGRLFRRVKKFEKVPADTSRKVGLTTAAFDLFRVVKATENVSADLLRRTGNSEKSVADSLRKITRTENISADTLRRVVETSKTTADTLRRVANFETASADTLRKVSVSEKTSADTYRKVTATEKAVADTCRRMIERASADTCRKVTRAEKSVADTVLRLPHVLNFIAQDSLVDTFKDYDLALFEVTLSERTLSDTFALETARQIEINDAIKGTFLDYPFSFLVEETTKRDLFLSVKGMYDIDKLLYSFIETDLREERADEGGYYKASSYISRIAAYLGFSPNIKIEDFTPYNLIGNTNITYSDLISSLFSWTSKLPQRQINVFIRGGILHCIQRGYEDSVFDISDIPHSRPTVNKKLLRSMYNSPFDSDDDLGEEAYDKPFSGTIGYTDAYSSNSITYFGGLLQKEYSRSNNSTTTTISSSEYKYTSFHIEGETQYYLDSKSTKTDSINWEEKTRTIEEVKTEYIYTFSHEQTIEDDEDGKGLHYGLRTEVYMREEVETKKTTTLSGDGLGWNWSAAETETSIRKTLHTPAGNGWYSTTVYENGEHMGSTISQGAPSNQVSLYTTQRIRQIFGTQSTDPDEIYEENRSRLTPIADTSFPVQELDLIQRLTDDLKWLNRKIQITVSVDLISKIEKGVPTLKHIVDFTERVKLDGYEYFLVSNRISFTPRKLIQSLQLVRWQ